MENFSKEQISIPPSLPGAFGGEASPPPHRFSVGDRVIYRRRRAGCAELDGHHKHVIYKDNTDAPYTVEFDEPIGIGITDERAIENGILPRHEQGWFCMEANLDPEEEYGGGGL